MSLDLHDAARALAAAPPRVEAEDPFFVVGTDRSGTTLLRMMLDSHPDLAIPPETHFIPALYKAMHAARKDGSLGFGLRRGDARHQPRDGAESRGAKT